MRSSPHLKEFVDFAQVYPFLCIQLVYVADISIHQIQAKPHDLKHRFTPSLRKGFPSAEKF